MLENLKNELVGREMSFLDLDNYMMSQGFYSVWDDGVTGNIKEDLNVVYISTKTNEAEIQIFFNITIDDGEEAFIMEITSVEEF